MKRDTAPSGNSRLAAGYAALGADRAIAAIVPTFTAAAALVAGTDLVASLPASLVDVLGARLGLRRVVTPLAPIRTPIDLLWHQRTQNDPAQQLFRDVLVRAASA